MFAIGGKDSRFKGAIMQRREFIMLLGAAAVGWPLAPKCEGRTKSMRLNPNEEQSVHNSSLRITTAVYLTIHNRLT
jgi:hypothetical protein